MRVSIEPFRPGHFEATAALLQTCLRAGPAPSAGPAGMLAQASDARGALRELLVRGTHGGAVAFRHGRLAGYLLATLHPSRLPSIEAAHPDPRSAWVALAGHAAEPAVAGDVYPQLYAQLAPRWLQAGCRAHYVDVGAGDAAALEAWQGLGFAREAAVAVRSCAPVPGFASRQARVRTATPSDVETIVDLLDELARALVAPPFSGAYEADTRSLLHRRTEAELADPQDLILLAEHGGKPAGVLTARGRTLLPLQEDLDCSVFVEDVYVRPEARGAGMLMLNEALAWARASGRDFCLTAWRSPNLPAAAVCQAIGFTPLLVRLRRLVEPARADGGDTELG